MSILALFRFLCLCGFWFCTFSGDCQYLFFGLFYDWLMDISHNLTALSINVL
nr:MAG TPA: hypothetical protein [Caudoviricetes sp.]DAS11441.1 MAG TPA: hypothetical protein [Caudoviricetes sp.]